MARVILVLAAVSACAARAAAAHPVIVGFERADTSDEAKRADAGELLLGELGCINCHRADDAVAARIPAHRGPRLDAPGAGGRPSYIRRYLSDVHATKPGAVMPDLLAGESPARRRDHVDALVHFIASVRTPAGQGAPAVKGSAERGLRLYHRTGCAACHAPDPAYRPAALTEDVHLDVPQIPSVPLGTLASKYTAAQLAAFLLDPLASRPTARMPRIALQLQEAADLAAYLIRQPTPPEPAPAVDASRAKRGKEIFASTGCAACHDVRHDGAAVRSTRDAKPLAHLDASSAAGCLASQSQPGIPQYSLSDRQRAALRAAIARVTAPRAFSPAERAMRMMTALNCFACHARDSRGGAEPARAVYFEPAAEVGLGHEGRLPPPLTGVGAKLQPAALRAVIDGNDAIRPYLATRMPSFGPHHAERLAASLIAADVRADEVPVVRSGRNMWGRQLVDDAGLSCITCHKLRGHDSIGVTGTDLAIAPKRLRPEWFRDFLIDPARYRPNTQMPAFWPDGEASDPRVIGGDTPVQIDSIWVYLMEVDQTRLPEGLESKGTFELKPSDRPIVFRTFMKGAGLHAIAVGFPQQVHVAFDAEQVRFALAWRGRFLDAESTWDNRFTPLTAPLGQDVIALAPGVPLATLPDAHAPWPSETGAAAGYRMGGYRLNERGEPTFLYHVDDVAVEDQVVPSASGRGLRRTFRLTGATRPLWFRAAVGKQIQRNDDGAWRVDEQFTVRVEPASTSAVRVGSFGFQQELRVAVELADGEAELVMEWTW